MLKRCGGVPLAVIVLCGVLKTKKSLREWHVVHGNIKSYIAKGEKIGEKGEVAKVLEFSYYDLPYQLKPCFLYLGKMKEDYWIGAERLYQLWIAEGMVLASDRMEQETLMDVAERYLDELAKRCLVQVEQYEESEPASTRFESCGIHDLMRDLCLYKAKEENLYKVIDSGHGNISSPSANSSPAIESYFGYVFHSFGDKDKYVPPSKEQTKHLRSLWCQSNWDRFHDDDGRIIMSQVNNFKMLRVLVIEYYDLAYQPQRRLSKSSLECIGRLIHLRFLSLVGSKILELPSSLSNLNYLETLDLRGIQCSRIIDVLWELKRLKHLYLSWGKLQLDRLGQRLEILQQVDNRNCDLKVLSKFTNLRVLKVKVYENFGDLVQVIDHISSLNYMRFTSLVISGCDFGTDSNSCNNKKGLAVLEKMLFCKNLHELEIFGTLCKQLPDYQPYLFPSPALTELTLVGSNIEEDPMPTLEQFPNLRKLFLIDKSFVGEEMICHAMGFPQLKILRLHGLYNLEKWKVDQGAMPKLSNLWISHCRKLEMIPGGLRPITTLRKIMIADMPTEFINRVQIIDGIEGQDYDKIRHVPSVVAAPIRLCGLHRPIEPVLCFAKTESI